METKVVVLIVAVLGTSACTELAPGRCDSTSDCAPGLTCNLDRTLQGNGRCVSPMDGGTPDGAAGAAGEGGDATMNEAGGTSGIGAAGHDGGAGDAAPEVPPACTSSTECPVTTPICDAGGACRPCDAGTVASTACA